MVILKGVTLASVQVVDAKSNVKPEYGNCGEAMIQIERLNMATPFRLNFKRK